jgi:nucleotide-binding universal stress UspA family protein
MVMEAVMKNILLLVHDDEGQEARFQAALDVTRAVEGHLTCLDVSVMPVLVDDYYSGAGVAMILDDERTREAANKTKLEARLAREQVAWDWIDATGTIVTLLTNNSALADLIVVNRRLDSFPLPDMEAIAGEVVVKAGKPILAIPESSRGINVCGRALVCWDGSAASTSALRAAVPLLQLAEAVILLEVDDGSIVAPAEEAASYLSRNGIEPTIVRRGILKGEAAEGILDEVSRRKADYVVMGGFSHLRFTEALFGGVTRRLLAESPVPLFLAH